MRILMTGATGFIGSNLIRDLCQTTDHAFSIVKRERSDTSALSDILDKIKVYTLDPAADNIYEILAQEKPDMIIHLATLFLGSHSRAQVPLLVESNILFPTKLLDAMASSGVRKFINTGSFSEHWNCKTEYDPVNLYSSTKRALEDILCYYVNAHHIKAITLKLFDTYGPHDPRPKIFSILKKGLREDSPIDLSPGQQTIDFLYIEDVVEAYKKAIEFLGKDTDVSYETVFIGSGQSHTIREVVSIFQEVAGRKINVNWGARSYREREIMIAIADIRKADDLLAWRPRVSLKQGLSKMMTEEEIR